MDDVERIMPASDRTLPSPQFLDRKETDLGEKGFKCISCSLIFANKEELCLHSMKENLPKEDEKSKGSISCPNCESVFSSYKGMRQHYGKIHKLNQKAKCKICNKRFKDNYAVKFHKKQVHDKSTQIKCVLCEKLSYNRYTHKAHFKKCSLRFFSNDVAEGFKDNQ